MKVIKFDFNDFKNIINRIFDKCSLSPILIPEFTTYINEVYDEIGLPKNGAISKCLINYLIFKNQLTIHESKQSEKSFIIWNKNIQYDMQALFNELFEYIKDKKNEKGKINRIPINSKPINREFPLRAHVFIIKDNIPVECVIKGVSIDENDENTYIVEYRDTDIHDNEIYMKRVMKNEIFSNMDELVTYFRNQLKKYEA